MPQDTGRILAAQTAPLDGSGVTASVSAVARTANIDTICVYGTITGLEPSLTSFLAGGSDCNVANGCGAHIHEGTDCTSTETQMGHYYAGDGDPWRTVGYLSTDENGAGEFVECVNTGTAARDYDGKAFVIHDSAGARVSCGILSVDIGPTEPPTQVPTMSPVQGPPPTPPTQPPIATAAPTTETVAPGETRAPTTSVPTRAPTTSAPVAEPPSAPSAASYFWNQRMGLAALVVMMTTALVAAI